MPYALARGDPRACHSTMAGRPRDPSMSRYSNFVRRPTAADGALTLCVRLLLVAVGVGVLTVGLYRLPSIAMTQGEVVTGILLSLAVALQILFAALFFPVCARRL